MKTLFHFLKSRRSLLSRIFNPLAITLLLAGAGPVLGGEAYFPDLRPTNASITGPAATGQPATLSSTIANDGPGAVPGTEWTDKIYLSEDNILRVTRCCCIPQGPSWSMREAPTETTPA